MKAKARGERTTKAGEAQAKLWSEDSLRNFGVNPNSLSCLGCSAYEEEELGVAS